MKRQVLFYAIKATFTKHITKKESFSSGPQEIRKICDVLSDSDVNIQIVSQKSFFGRLELS